MDALFRLIKKMLPKKVFAFFQPAYHFALAIFGALWYRFPSRKLAVIGITGTKGKTSTAELINSILEEAGFSTALAGTLRFKIGEKEIPNTYKMTMPGRLFQQKFLRRAVNAGCTHAILEMTSEGAKQFRHRFIDLDILVFTNLAPEHIESHGSYEKYRDAKLAIARALGKSGKKNTAIIANADDPEGKLFLDVSGNIAARIPYSLADAKNLEIRESGISFFLPKDELKIHSHLRGKFNVSNILAAIAVAKHFGVPKRAIAAGIERVSEIRGRMEKIAGTAGGAEQAFEIIVDYAHTPDSLRAAYGALSRENREKQKKLVCILGSTGGGRDQWKRPEMGRIAEEYCSHIILTDEDPYDEDPQKIIREVKSGISPKGQQEKTEVILDRREAIRRGIFLAKKTGDEQNSCAVIITGKGTDPYIMLADGKKLPWDDAQVAREELAGVS